MVERPCARSFVLVTGNGNRHIASLVTPDLIRGDGDWYIPV